MHRTSLLTKKIIICLALYISFASVCFANIVPLFVNDIPNCAIGLYQTDKRVTIREKPSDSSKILYDRDILYSDLRDVKQDCMFAVLVPSKELGYVYVTDVSDDEKWVEVIFDKTSNSRGWVKKNDDFQFLDWVSFFNMYGRKYGVKNLISKDIDIIGMFSNPSDSAQIIGKVSRPKSIKMISVDGLWMLVTVLELSGNTSTGYVKWRSDAGNLIFFPQMK